MEEYDNFLKFDTFGDNGVYLSNIEFKKFNVLNDYSDF